jgi:excisionase family DNA binding protein
MEAARGAAEREALLEGKHMSETQRATLLTRKEAADYLGLKPQTLAVWHCTGRYGLPVVKVGRSCRYRLADLEAWLAARTVGAVAEEQGVNRG